MTGRNIMRTLLLAVLTAAGPHANAQYNAAAQLEAENRLLRMEVDSLRRALGALCADTYDTWSGLSGIEDDDAPPTGADDGSRGEFDGLSRRPEVFDGTAENELDRRLAMASPLCRIPYRPLLDSYVELYTIRKRRSMPAIIGRYENWYPAFEKAFREAGVPEELIALCVVESAVSPRALSKAGAAGMWQLMPGTARDEGLRVDGDVDERYSVEKATAVAARYLKSMHRTFGSWPLAVSAYNCGPGNVRKAVAKAGGRTDFWSVYDYLPKETKGYLPSLLAVRYVLCNRAELGIGRKDGRDDGVVYITFRQDVTFRTIYRKTGLSQEWLRWANPQYVSGTVPAGERVGLPKRFADMLYVK